MYSTKRRISFYYCDPAGILFYANIFKLAHEAYEELINSFDKENSFFEHKSFVIPIIHSEADYVAPLKFNDDVEIQVNVSVLKDSSFELTYNIYRGVNELVAKVKTVHVFVEKEKFKKHNLEKEFKEFLETHLS